MNMFQPQEIICTDCLHHGLIITEDFWIESIEVLSKDANGPSVLRVDVNCPHCHNVFKLEMKRMRIVGNHLLFECVSPLNTGLQMWRLMLDDSLKMPNYHPNFAYRPNEQALDNKCKKIADDLIGWKQSKAPSQNLEMILGQVEDYTKGNSWNNFYGKHKVVAVCGDISTGMMKPGFSGKFYSINYKNADLMNAILSELGEPDNSSKLFCNNPVGHCAEVHAANSFLYYESTHSLNTLSFSIAYRVRDAQPRSYCMNCITLFKLTNA